MTQCRNKQKNIENLNIKMSSLLTAVLKINYIPIQQTLTEDFN